jgi:hypothetical protein
MWETNILRGKTTNPMWDREMVALVSFGYSCWMVGRDMWRELMGGCELQWQAGTLDRHISLCACELWVKTMHQPRLISAVVPISVVLPLLGGIVVAPFHHPCCLVYSCGWHFLVISSSTRWCVALRLDSMSKSRV